MANFPPSGSQVTAGIKDAPNSSQARPVHGDTDFVILHISQVSKIRCIENPQSSFFKRQQRA